LLFLACLVLKPGSLKNNPPVIANKIKVFMFITLVIYMTVENTKTLQLHLKKVILAHP